MRKPSPTVEIVSTGRYLPDHVLTNADLEKMVETDDAWIVERTGIRERRIAEGMGAAEMGARAARVAMERAGIAPGEVDMIVVSTATPDRWLPSTACDMQALLGTDNAMAFDVCAACTGWLYALSMAEGYLMAGRGEIALVFRDSDCLVFVEVKARSSEDWARPAAAVNAAKKRKLSATARDYLRALKEPRVKFRFDIVEVLLTDGQGGFALSSLAGVPTRCHAGLVVSQQPPVSRFCHLVSPFERLEVGGESVDLHALEMTKWFDTNYHYLVPELHAGQAFALRGDKPVAEFAEALAQGIRTRPVLIGPLTFLLLSKKIGRAHV